ncbi:Transmembrane protein 8A [Sparganum proliferum]
MKPFTSNRDMRIVRVMVPPHTLAFNVEISAKKADECDSLGIEMNIQPKSLPVVRPFQVPLPPYTFPSVESTSFVGSLGPRVANTSASLSGIYKLNFPVYAREAGEWFIAIYVSGTFNTDSSCRLWLFPKAIFEVLEIDGRLSTTNIASSPCGSPSVKFGQFDVPDHLDNKTRLPIFNSLSLSASSEKIYSFLSPPDATSLDFVLLHCFSSPEGVESVPGVDSQGRVHRLLSHPANNASSGDWKELSPASCPITIELSTAGPPLSLLTSSSSTSATQNTSELPQKKLQPLHNNDDAVDRASESLLKRKLAKPSGAEHGTGNLPSDTPTLLDARGERFPVSLKLRELRGHDNVVNYLYLKNHQPNGRLLINFRWRPHFDCPPINGHNRFPPRTDIPDDDDDSARISLLPWVNASWIELTPLYGRRAHTSTTTAVRFTLDGGIEKAGAAFQPVAVHSFSEADPGSLVLPRCTTWSPLSRSDLSLPFAFQFSYQPKLANLENLLHLKPWHAVAIPFDLTSSQDSGGTLEVSLQLEPVETLQRVNGTLVDRAHRRQVILHGCLARAVATTPLAFTSEARCPLWLRLATSRGVGVSVAAAVMAAVQMELASSQPPHRSERMPEFDTSFNESLDRSFLFTPYPAYGRWYLTLYAECYSDPSAASLCAPNASANIPVMVLVRSTPCINQRCRDVGEPSTLPPARKLVQDTVGLASETENVRNWRPLWWWERHRPHFRRYSQEPLPGDVDFFEDVPRGGEGLCTELLQQSTFTSICSCPPGRAGLGCMVIPPAITSPGQPTAPPDPSTPPSIGRSQLTMLSRPAIPPPNGAIWPSLSTSARWLAWSNFAFIPAILLAFVRRLWIPFLAYSYTMSFSIMYHICDTDVLLIAASLPDRVLGGAHHSFGGFAIAKSDMYKLIGYKTEPASATGSPLLPSYLPSYAGDGDASYRLDASEVSLLRFTSLQCPLPLETLSLCDFFGGVFSIAVTALAASALPVLLAEIVIVVTVLALTVAVQVMRYSPWFHIIPVFSFVTILLSSWIYRTVQLKRLFPPIQWLLLSFLPSVLLSLTAVSIFLSPQMKSNYTHMHSLWHILIAFALLGALPWPMQWRRALSPVIPLSTALSCGGNQRTFSCTRRRVSSPNDLLDATSGSPMSPNSLLDASTVKSTLARIYAQLARVFSVLSSFKSRVETRLDRLLELNFLLDPLVARFPRLRVILPHGYWPKRSDKASETVSERV